MHRWLFATLTSFTTAAVVWAQPADVPHAKVEVLADTAIVAPGKPFTVALHFKIDEGWHLYHKDPGDSGEPPKVKWKLPEGFTASELRFPPAEKETTPAGVNNVYFHDVALLATITPPATLSANQTVTLEGNVRWLVCDKETCIPDKSPVKLSIPSGTDSTPANEASFKKWKALVESAPTTAPSH
ncbi:MAG: protein-disulfide reductase DsbD family protein [Tepidisphaeraceae bacterium]